MARRVVCQICKAEGTNETFFRVQDDNGRNKYYCSQEEYENYIREQEERKRLLEYIALEILEYEDGQIVPPVMVKRINKLHEFYPYEVIHETFSRNKDSIHYWIKVKKFTNEYGMVAYVMAIIEGSINDVYKDWKFKKLQEQKRERNSVDIDFEDVNHIFKQQENKETNQGILAFLEEDDI